MKRVAIALAVLTAAAGCVQRSVTIKTVPPGAIVYVDGDRVGVSPTTMKFTFYGTRRFEAEKEGYERASKVVTLKEPWYERFGIDFFTEVLWPFTVNDEHTVILEMKKITPKEEGLLERAKEARKMLPGSGGKTNGEKTHVH